jgi:hypothetical protein
MIKIPSIKGLQTWRSSLLAVVFLITKIKPHVVRRIDVRTHSARLHNNWELTYSASVLQQQAVSADKGGCPYKRTYVQSEQTAARMLAVITFT